jgi:hypothetical protein
MEYASSPVAQPVTQTLTCSSAPLPSNRRGTPSVSSPAKAVGSRKKLVTLMSRSASRSCSSAD